MQPAPAPGTCRCVRSTFTFEGLSRPRLTATRSEAATSGRSVQIKQGPHGVYNSRPGLRGATTPRPLPRQRRPVDRMPWRLGARAAGGHSRPGPKVCVASAPAAEEPRPHPLAHLALHKHSPPPAAAPCVLPLLASPNLAASERVFSLLKLMFVHVRTQHSLIKPKPRSCSSTTSSTQPNSTQLN